MKPVFCPKCHKQIVLPDWLKQNNVNVENAVTIQCSNCPKGKIKYKPTKKEQ